MKLMVYAPGTMLWHVSKYEISGVTTPEVHRGGICAGTLTVTPRLRCAPVASVFGPYYILSCEDGREYMRPCEAVATTEAAAAAHATDPSTLRHYHKGWPNITTPRLFQERYGAEGHAVFEVLPRGTRAYFNERYRKVNGALQPVIVSGVIRKVHPGECNIACPPVGLPMSNLDVHHDKETMERVACEQQFIDESVTIEVKEVPGCDTTIIRISRRRELVYVDQKCLAARLRMLAPARQSRAA